MNTANTIIQLKRHWWVRLVSVVGMAFFLWLAGLTYVLNQLGPAAIFGLFVALAVYNYLLTMATTTVTHTELLTQWLGITHKMSWEEVESVATNAMPRSAIGNMCVLTGNNKRFVVDLSPGMVNRSAVKYLIEQQTQRRSIRRATLNTFSFKNRNTRVKLAQKSKGIGG